MKWRMSDGSCGGMSYTGYMRVRYCSSRSVWDWKEHDLQIALFLSLFVMDAMVYGACAFLVLMLVMS